MKLVDSSLLEITWDKGSLKSNSSLNEVHVSQLHADWLTSINHPRNVAGMSHFRQAIAQEQIWNAHEFASNETRFEYDDFMNTESGLLNALIHLKAFGLCFLKNVPTDNHEQVEKVATRISLIRETFYGRSWDVKSIPQAKNIAYTSLNLGLHMDLL